MDCGRCTAKTKSGVRCKLSTCKSELCWRHLKANFHLRVKPSGVHGLGLFAEKATKGSKDIVFKKGQKVIDYKGEIINPTKKEKRAAKGKDGYMAELSSGYVVDAIKTNSGAGRFANDCRGTGKQCNSKFTRKRRRNPHDEVVSIKAKKNIRHGQEITISYGRSYWSKNQSVKRRKK